jgi:hypothetical protein
MKMSLITRAMPHAKYRFKVMRRLLFYICIFISFRLIHILIASLPDWSTRKELFHSFDLLLSQALPRSGARHMSSAGSGKWSRKGHKKAGVPVWIALLALLSQSQSTMTFFSSCLSLSIYPPIYLSIIQSSTFPLAIHPSIIYVSIHPSIHLPTYLPTYLSFFPSFYMYTYIYTIIEYICKPTYILYIIVCIPIHVCMIFSVYILFLVDT